MKPEEAFRDDLGETLAEAWRLLARGVADRRHGFHHPAVATIGLDGRPRVRTVILRGVDVAARALRFHTDVRSLKVEELARDARASLLFYDAGAKAQVRIEGHASIHAGDSVADAAWAGSRAMSRACYGTSPAPGGVIPDGSAFSLPGEDDDLVAAGRENFRAAVIVADSLEWLHLGHGGHRRALYEWADGQATANWLVP
jgi:pyridoxamine 5'-phosphate oxidase